jgi:beta-D-xylosidase 4
MLIPSEWRSGICVGTHTSCPPYLSNSTHIPHNPSVFNSHHYEATPEQAVRDILRAGTDVDCGSFMTKHAADALANGNITEADIDTVLTRLFRVRLRLGHFERSTPLDAIGLADVCSASGRELGRDGARQSIVLAKNDDGLLPLTASAYSTAIMIGPNLNLTSAWGQGRARTACAKTPPTLTSHL